MMEEGQGGEIIVDGRGWGHRAEVGSHVFYKVVVLSTGFTIFISCIINVVYFTTVHCIVFL